MIPTRSILVVSLLFVLWSDLVYSQTIYKWRDHEGNTHFTTTYENIPPEYRNQVQKPGTEKESDRTGVPPTKEGVEKADTRKKTSIEEKAKKAEPKKEAPILKRAPVEGTSPPSHPIQIPRKAEKETRPKFEFEGRYWITDLTASIKNTEFGVGTRVDFTSDLGLDDENLPELRFTWYTGPKSRLRLAYTQVEYSGDENLDRTIEFGGETFTTGTRVETDLDVKYLRLGWAWQFIDLAKGRVRLGPLLEAKGFWVDTSLEAPDLVPSIEESVEAVGGLPTVGAILDINPHRAVDVFAEVSGMYAGKYGYALDGEVGVKIIPIKNLSILGGWRIIDFKIEDDPDFVKLELTGPFIGATWRF